MAHLNCSGPAMIIRNLRNVVDEVLKRMRNDAEGQRSRGSWSFQVADVVIPDKEQPGQAVQIVFKRQPKAFHPASTPQETQAPSRRWRVFGIAATTVRRELS